METAAANQARKDGHTLRIPIMSPMSFVSDLFLDLSVPAGAGHTTGRRDGTARTGWERPRERESNTKLCYLTF